MGFEAASREGIEVQRLLVDLDLLFEANLGDGNERSDGGVGALDFDPNNRVTCHRVGKALLASRAILRRRRRQVARSGTRRTHTSSLPSSIRYGTSA